VKKTRVPGKGEPEPSVWTRGRKKRGKAWQAKLLARRIDKDALEQQSCRRRKENGKREAEGGKKLSPVRIQGKEKRSSDPPLWRKQGGGESLERDRAPTPLVGPGGKREKGGKLEY